MANQIQITTGVDSSGAKTGLERMRADGAKFSGDFQRTVAAAFSVGAVVAFTKSLFDTTAKYESLQTAFKTMLGSAEQAKQLMEDLGKFAAATPFQLDELANASRLLLAFGVSADQLIPKLRQIGDVSSAIGAPLGEIAEIFGKAKVQGTLFAEDINQLVGRGIPVIQEFAKQLGVTEGEIKKLASEGRITFPMLEQAFVALTSEGGKFNNMMEEQSQTAAGMASTLQDNFAQIQRTLGNSLLPTVKEITGEFSKWTASTEGKDSVNWLATLLSRAAGMVRVFLAGFQHIRTDASATFSHIVAKAKNATGAMFGAINGQEMARRNAEQDRKLEAALKDSAAAEVTKQKRIWESVRRGEPNEEEGARASEIPGSFTPKPSAPSAPEAPEAPQAPSVTVTPEQPTAPASVPTSSGLSTDSYGKLAAAQQRLTDIENSNRVKNLDGEARMQEMLRQRANIETQIAGISDPVARTKAEQDLLKLDQQITVERENQAETAAETAEIHARELADAELTLDAERERTQVLNLQAQGRDREAQQLEQIQASNRQIADIHREIQAAVADGNTELANTLSLRQQELEAQQRIATGTETEAELRQRASQLTAAGLQQEADILSEQANVAGQIHAIEQQIYEAIQLGDAATASKLSKTKEELQTKKEILQVDQQALRSEREKAEEAERLAKLERNPAIAAQLQAEAAFLRQQATISAELLQIERQIEQARAEGDQVSAQHLEKVRDELATKKEIQALAQQQLAAEREMANEVERRAEAEKNAAAAAQLNADAKARARMEEGRSYKNNPDAYQQHPDAYDRSPDAYDGPRQLSEDQYWDKAMKTDAYNVGQMGLNVANAEAAMGALNSGVYNDYLGQQLNRPAGTQITPGDIATAIASGLGTDESAFIEARRLRRTSERGDNLSFIDQLRFDQIRKREAEKNLRIQDKGRERLEKLQPQNDNATIRDFLANFTLPELTQATAAESETSREVLAELRGVREELTTIRQQGLLR
ncbi:MAG TPA: tape measure protein [Chthoniobacterales bacterium]